MSCASCVRCVESGLIKIQAVKSVRIGLLSEKAEIVYDGLQIEPEEIVAAIKSLGYGASVVKISKLGSLNKEVYVSIAGMSCSNCSAKIEKDLLTLPGIVSANVSCTLNKACIVIDESVGNALGVRDLMERIESLGYGCSLSSDSGAGSTDGFEDIRQWQQLLTVALVLGLPVLLLHMTMSHFPLLMGLYTEPMLCSGGISAGNVLTGTASSFMQVLVGYKFYRSALLGALHSNFGMDCLVVTGTTITFVYSCVQLYYSCKSHVIARHIFFEASAMLLMFVTLGKFIEAYAKGKTVSAITNLLKMQPRNALLLSNALKSGVTIDSSEAAVRDIIHREVLKEISIDLVQRGDILKVLPGSRIPTDGFILYGSTHVDESMITGESQSQRRTKGALLFGSTLNQSAAIYLQVSSVGSESALAQIIRLVEKAQMNKAPIQAYADKVASVFTPIVLCLALTTFLVWSYLCAEHLVPSEWYSEEYGSPLLFSMLFGISVVVISCPCALGLATPTAIMVGTSVGAQLGILIKGGPAFEAAQNVNVVVFDKTGTLTVGKPSVTDELVFLKDELVSGSSTRSDERVLATTGRMLELALAAEKGSEHPLADAITKAAAARGITAPRVLDNSFEIIAGCGISCSVAEGRVLVGNRAMLSSRGIALTPVVEKAMWKLENQGKTVVCVALEKDIVGVIAVADTLKPDAYSALSALKKTGVEVWMITGDNSTTAAAIAEELDIDLDNVLAGVMPVDKVSKIEALQATGKFVAMVGDGVNDSPALARADLGIAIGAGTQVAIEAADMVLVRNKLEDVVVALDLSRVVFRRIKLNFLWALVYNLAAIPFAAGLWFPWTHMLLPPQYAGLSMAFSSISVVLSSMALRLYKRPRVLEAGDGQGEDRIKEAGMAAMVLQVAGGSGLRKAGAHPGASLYAGFAGGSRYSKLSSDDERDSIELGLIR